MPAVIPLEAPLEPPNSVSAGKGQLDQFERDLVMHFQDLAGAVGLPRSFGEIYGLLYASTRPLSFTEIQEKLELSKGTVSQSLRALREIGAVRRDTDSHERRDNFVAETELRNLIGAFLNGCIVPRLEHGGKQIA